jgi:FkbM family methyltransferase
MDTDTYYTQFHGEILNNKDEDASKAQAVDQSIREYFPDYNYKGVFLDVGAFEPIRISNSYHFEKNGWDVYCFEANTNSIPLLKAHRANVLNYAIYNCDLPDVEFNVVTTNGWTAGFSAIEINQDIQKAFHTKLYDNQIQKIKVPQRTLNTVLSSELAHITNIDVLKIDIEGGELKCLQGLDLSKYKPRLIVLENITNNIDIKDYLYRVGYKLDKQISYNQFYLLEV